MSSYPKYLIDDLRVKIATDVTKKELRKYYSSLDEEAIRKVEKDLERFANFKDDIAICNFWDLIYAYTFEMMRKEWVNYLTAENVSWAQEKISTGSIHIEWPELGEPPLKEMGEPPYTQVSINKWLDQNPEFRIRQLRNSDHRSEGTLPRDDYPIIGIKSKNVFKVEDGNRRVLRAILYNKPYLQSYTCQMANNIIKNYWIATGVMRQLILAAERAGAEESEQIFQIYKQVFTSLFEQSSVARITYEIRVASRYFGQRNPLAARFLI